MENQSPTQKKSSDVDIQEYHKKKEKFASTIKDNLNYIYIVLMIIANCLISILRIEDASVAVRTPSSAVGWVMWAVQIAISTFIGVMILNAFRRQGIQSGHKIIKDIKDAYIEALRTPTAEQNPRSLKQYMTKVATKDSLQKAFVYIVLSVFVGTAVISANWNNLLSLAVNIIFAVGFGIKAMLDAEEYVITELALWYKLKTKELNEKENIKNERLQKRNSKPRLRPTKSSGVQPKEEHCARQDTGDTQQSGQSAT